jgi:hypothetical protein
MRTKFLPENFKGKCNLGELGIDGRGRQDPILKWVVWGCELD